MVTQLIHLSFSSNFPPTPDHHFNPSQTDEYARVQLEIMFMLAILNWKFRWKEILQMYIFYNITL